MSFTGSSGANIEELEDEDVVLVHGLFYNDNEILLELLRAVFESMATAVPVIGSFAVSFLKSLHLFKKQLGFDQDKFIKYVVCPKCDTPYNFDDCFELHYRERVSKNCTFVEFPNHRHPFTVYCYQSVRNTLTRFLIRPGFAIKCELWRDRGIPQGFLPDVFNGRVWKEWQLVCQWRRVLGCSKELCIHTKCRLVSTI